MPVPPSSCWGREPNWRPSEYVYEEDGCVRILRWPVVKLLDYAERLDEIEAVRTCSCAWSSPPGGQRTRENVPGRAAWNCGASRAADGAI